MKNDDKICVLGLGFIGLTLAATLAEAGFKVLGVDVLPEVVNSLSKKNCYFFEPGLNELINKCDAENLSYSTAIPDDSCNYYVICVGTPIDYATGKPKLEYIINSANSLLPHVKKGDTIILRSTVPMGTSRTVVMRMIERKSGLRAGEDFYFGFVPERTIEGNALHEQKHIPQIIGALDQKSADRISRIFSTYNDKLIYVPDIEHAELCKVIDNTYRDVTFAYSNQMAMICEEMGLDFHAVRKACNSDYPRNNIPLPSPGVGGACLTKDPYILVDLCKKLDIDTKLINAARGINEEIVFHLAKKILNRLTSLGRSVYNSKIFIMGFAFKGEPETSDMRFSTTIDLINYLKPFCSRLYGYDGVVSGDQLIETGVEPSSIEDGFDGADVVVIMNSHFSHKGLDIQGLSRKSGNPLIFVDCWCLYDKQEIQSFGNIIYSSVGLY